VAVVDEVVDVLVAPGCVVVDVPPTPVVLVVDRAVVVVVEWVVEVVGCSTGLAVVEVVGDTETDTGIWAVGVVRTER